MCTPENRVVLWIPNISRLNGELNENELMIAFHNHGLFPGQLFYPTEVSPGDFHLNTLIPLRIDVPDGYGFDHLLFMRKDQSALNGEHNLSTNRLLVPVNLYSLIGGFREELLAKYFKECWKFLSAR